MLEDLVHKSSDCIYFGCYSLNVQNSKREKEMYGSRETYIKTKIMVIGKTEIKDLLSSFVTPDHVQDSFKNKDTGPCITT